MDKHLLDCLFRQNRSHLIEHTALCKLKPGVNQRRVKRATGALLSMRGKITGTREVIAGFSSSCEGKSKSKGYDYIIIVRIDNLENRDLYLHNPEHKSIAKQYVAPIINDGLVADLNH